MKGGLHQHGGRRYCAPCLNKLVDPEKFGGWTWGYGDCATCGEHLVLSVDEAPVLHLLECLANAAAEAGQLQLFEES